MILILIFSSGYDIGGLIAYTDGNGLASTVFYFLGSFTGSVSAFFRVYELVVLDKIISKRATSCSTKIEIDKNLFLPMSNANLFANVYILGVINSLIGLSRLYDSSNSSL